MPTSSFNGGRRALYDYKRRTTRWRLVWAASLLIFMAAAARHSHVGSPPAAAAEALGRTPQMKPYVETVPGTEVRFEMAPIPGGSFVMGSPASEQGRAADEGPQHEVSIRPFWMGVTEVTWDEYDLFAFSLDLKKDRPAAGERPSVGVDAVTRPTPPYADESFGYGKGRQPVISITHHAAMEYCRWLSAKTGKTYRLPTEAEWEYACRAGSKSAYSFGGDAKGLADHAWYAANSDGQPHAVGQKRPNRWGLFDMHGNVAEWCVDQYGKDFYASFRRAGAALSPVLLPDERRYPHVVRGGSWDDDAPLLRSAARRASRREWSRRDPQRPQSIWWHTDAITVGFRVVRPLEEQEGLKGLRSKITRQSPD
jgi:formylglycine-generating enzyme required for sulfatase activity